MKETKEMNQTIYCESICTALAEVRKTCGEEIYNKILGCLPNLTKSVGQEKISKYMNTALLTVENIQSANKPTNGNIDSLSQTAELLERGYYHSSHSDIVKNKNGKQFWEQFIALIRTDLEEKIRKEVYFDCPFDLSVLDGKEVPSLSQIIKELLTIDPKLDYVILLKCANNVFKECYDSEFEVEYVMDGELFGYYWPIVPEGFANLFRQDLIHAVKKHDLTIFNKLLCSLPLLKSLPKFTYKPQRLM